MSNVHFDALLCSQITFTRMKPSFGEYEGNRGVTGFVDAITTISRFVLKRVPDFVAASD